MTLGEHPPLPDPPPADLLRYGDETGHDPTSITLKDLMPPPMWDAYTAGRLVRIEGEA